MKKFVYIFALCVLLISCKTQYIVKEVPVEVEVEKIVYKNKIQHDSIYVIDSIKIYQKGDTVFKDVIKYKYNTKVLYDSLIIHDTVAVPKIINNTKIQEKKVPQWWPVWLSCGIVLLLIILYNIYKHKFKINI